MAGNYIEFDFESRDQGESDQLIALLGVHGFEGFEEGSNCLIAFIPEEDFDEKVFEDIIEKFPNLTYTRSVVENINWNADWESSFDPVIVDDFVAVRASFHASNNSVKHDIIITPKMSFGTGHHATTYMMLEQMRNIDFAGKKVLDFGTGTGVLAILAERLGAAEIVAIDHDEWSIGNAQENINSNECRLITLLRKNKLLYREEFDIILANINLLVIKENANGISNACKSNAILLLSGFLEADEVAISDSLTPFSFRLVNSVEKNGWISVQMRRG